MEIDEKVVDVILSLTKIVDKQMVEIKTLTTSFEAQTEVIEGNKLHIHKLNQMIEQLENKIEILEGGWQMANQIKPKSRFKATYPLWSKVILGTIPTVVTGITFSTSAQYCLTWVSDGEKHELWLKEEELNIMIESSKVQIGYKAKHERK